MILENIPSIKSFLIYTNQLLNLIVGLFKIKSIYIRQKESLNIIWDELSNIYYSEFLENEIEEDKKAEIIMCIKHLMSLLDFDIDFFIDTMNDLLGYNAFNKFCISAYQIYKNEIGEI